MKESHPDKFQGNEAGLKEAEERSKEIIEAYHFLVSINPETIKQGLPEFNETIATATIVDYKYENIRLLINFSNGSSYEFISVPKATYVKMVNADSPSRFAKDTFLMHSLIEKLPTKNNRTNYNVKSVTLLTLFLWFCMNKIIKLLLSHMNSTS